ncbi:MAG TPA: hypothetical protein VHR15_19510, partial [Ktedonobacterales bacterium]|nr:hypothetical protein [Ktedonobacterales bacterium]
MNASLPSALLRLREADIVRLCGFEAATRGLELAGRQAVSHARRDGAKLEATVSDETTLAVTAEVTDSAPNPALRWSCSAHTPASAGESPLRDGPGCEHVAALLTAWTRAPGDFSVPAQEAPPRVSASPGLTLGLTRGLPAEPAARAREARRPQRRPPSAPDMSLAGELTRLPARDLLALAHRAFGSDLTESEARERLAAVLANPAHVQATLARLDAHSRWLFGALLPLGGSITAADLEALAGRLGRPTSAVDADAQALARHGLLFSILAPHAEAGERSWRALAGWRIAPETRAAADDLYTLEALLNVSEGEAPLPTAGWRVERSSPREILLALALLARAPAPFGPLRRTDQTSPASQTDSQTAPLRVVGDLSAGRLAELARAAGLEPGLARMARRLLLWAREQAPGQPLLDLARLPQDERVGALRHAFALWRETDSVAELVDLDLSGASIIARVNTRHPAYSRAALAAEVGAARRFLLALLKRAQPGAWYALDDLLAFVWRAQPGFLRGRQRAFAHPVWTLERIDSDQRALRATVEGEWRAAEGAWIRALIAGPLRWWGAVDIAHDATIRAPIAFRLTPLGAHLLDAHVAPTDVALPDDWGPAMLLTRDQALAANPLSAGADLLDAVAQWARPISVVGGRLLYTLAPDLASAAFDHGLKPEALGERLRAADPNAGARVAEQVMSRLSAWRLKYGRTRVFE